MGQTTQPTFEGKPCRNCGQTLRFIAGSKQCVACKLISAKRYRDRNPNRDRGRYWGKLYGLQPGEAELLLKNQNDQCAICGKSDSKPWHIDHCHDSHKVRGILCQNCNIMLGMAKDNPQILLNGINYLNK